MTAELKPCPMCGSADVEFSSPGGADERSCDFVICNGCGVSAGRADCDGDLHEVWNRRAPSPSTAPTKPHGPEVVKVLQAALNAALDQPGTAPTDERAADLTKRLRIKAGMITMGEKIAWGSDSALMNEAADFIERAALSSRPAGEVNE